MKVLKTISLLTLIHFLTSLSYSCKSDDQALTPNASSNNQGNNGGGQNDTTITDPPPKASQMQLLLGEWILYETYTNNQLDRSNFADTFSYTSDGHFNFRDPQNGWQAIANYNFTADSGSIVTTFLGTNDPITMELRVLDSTNLHTAFQPANDSLLYKYRR